MYEPRLPSPCAAPPFDKFYPLLAPVVSKMSFRLTIDYETDDSSTDQATSSNSMTLEVSIS